MPDDAWVPVLRVKTTPEESQARAEELDMRLRCFEIAAEAQHHPMSAIALLARAKHIYAAVVEDGNWQPQDRR